MSREAQNAEGQTFPLSIPVCAVGTAAERLASELDEGDFVVITGGELVYRKRHTKAGEVSRLEVLAWRVQKGEPALAGVPAAVDTTPESIKAPPAKPRKRALPKHLQQPWTPSGRRRADGGDHHRIPLWMRADGTQATP